MINRARYARSASSRTLAALSVLLIVAGIGLIVWGQADTAARPDTPLLSPIAQTQDALPSPATLNAASAETPTPSVAVITSAPTTKSVAAPPDLQSYCLWPGDIASQIAANAGISQEALLAANPGWSGQAGSTIRLPAGSIAPAQWSAPLPPVATMNDLPFGVSGYYLGRNNRQKQVALSFDVGYAEGNLERMQMLRQRGVRATFFVLGGALVKHADIIGQILDNGHELGNHSFTHDNMLGMEPGIIAWELQITEQLTGEARAGASTKPLFRAPFGAINDTVVAVAEREGYHVVGWTVDSRDWTEQIRADELYQRVVDHVCPGAIIAFHDVNAANGPALPRLLDYLDRNGYRYVTVSEILKP